MFLKGYKLASPGALVALVCFFLPWMFVSCMGQPVAEFNGMELAVGPQINTVMGSQRADAAPLLFLIPLVSLVILVLAILAGRRRRVNWLDKLVTFLLGLLALSTTMLLPLALGSSPEIQQAREVGVAVELRLGFWGTALGLLLTVVGGVMNWFGKETFTPATSTVASVSPPEGSPG